MRGHHGEAAGGPSVRDTFVGTSCSPPRRTLGRGAAAGCTLLPRTPRSGRRPRPRPRSPLAPDDAADFTCASCRAASSSSAPSSASATVSVSGGRDPQRGAVLPPLPISSPPSRAASRTGRPPPGGLVGARPDQLDADHQTAAAHFAYDVEPGRDRPQPLDEQPADPPGVALEVVLEQVVEVGQAGGLVTGLPPKVEMELASRQSMTSARATTPPMDRPLPMPLAKVSMSGGLPVCLAAPEVVAGAAPAGLHLVG